MKINNNIRKIYINNIIYKLIKHLNNNKINEMRLLNNNNNNFNKLSLNNYNNKWDYSQIIYNFNNNNLLNKLNNKHLINRYISYILNQIIKLPNTNNNKYINILYREPILLFNNNTIKIILFIYNPLNKYNNIFISKIIDNILKINKINDINLEIKPIILKYDYLDSNIYSKSLSKFISKYPKFDKINNIKVNNNSTPWLNYFISDKLNTISIMNKIDYLLSNNNHNKYYINEKPLYFYNKDLIINNNLLYKYIIGYDWKFRGKNYNSESNARALRYYNNNGKLNINPLILKNYNPIRNFKLNNYSANLTKSQSYIINKNGKYNINVSLCHF